MKCGDYFKTKDGPREFGNISIITKWMHTTESSLILRCIEVKNKKVRHSLNPTQYLHTVELLRKTHTRSFYNDTCMIYFRRKSHHFLFCTFSILTGQIMVSPKALLLFVKSSKQRHPVYHMILVRSWSTAGLHPTLTYVISIIRYIYIWQFYMV